jgi:hypothetical protein
MQPDRGESLSKLRDGYRYAFVNKFRRDIAPQSCNDLLVGHETRHPARQKVGKLSQARRQNYGVVTEKEKIFFEADADRTLCGSALSAAGALDVFNLHF